MPPQPRPPRPSPDRAPTPAAATTDLATDTAEAPGQTAEALEPVPIVDEPVSPAHARLGSEGLARLRARFADVQAAISRRVADEQRREQLRADAERLNPDGWVTDDEVSAGLEQYESILASLRDVIGRRRRRRKGRPAPSAAPDAPADDGPESPEEDPGSGI